jgi:putative membrane protein
MLESLVRYVHFISIILLFFALAAEHLLLAEKLTPTQIRRLFRLDIIYGMAAILVLAAGFMLIYGVGKPSQFYVDNWVFNLKGSLFLLLGVLSIKPTAFYMKNRKSEAEWVTVPPSIVKIVRIELVLLMFIPLFAVFMAKGIGL